MAPMTAYAAFLRGVNLGPANKIAMSRLRDLAEGLGYGEVATYINSGNLVCTSTQPAATLAREISHALAAELPKPVDVAVRSRAQLEALVAANPYPDGDPSQVTVAFLMAEPGPGVADRIAAVAAAHEPFTVAGTEIWVNYTRGLARSKLAEQFARVVGVSATTRTIRTVQKVLALMPT